MIDNRVCPYCGQILTRVENADNCRSVEHLIPHVALTRKRTNEEGDFYACRQCNCRKSHIDYVLGMIVKAQSPHDELAANTLRAAVLKEDGRARRFIDMVRTARKGSDGIEMEMPIKGSELVEYLNYMGKGEFFKRHKIPYDPNRHVMEIQLINKQVLGPLEKTHFDRHGSNPFRELALNSRSEVINEGECVIFSKSNEFLFIFHHYTAVIVRVMRKTEENTAKAVQSEQYVLEHFTYAP